MLEYETFKHDSSRKKFIIVGILVGVIALGLGVVIGFFSRAVPAAVPCPTCGKEPCLGPDVPESIISKANEEIFDKLMTEISADNIRENLRQLTLRPHLAGTPDDLRTAEELESLWTSQGLSPVYKTPYDVLLSYPSETDPSLVNLLDGDGNSLFTSQKEEKILRPEQNQSDVVPPFNAYSPPGDEEGPLVYVNYGRIEDFIFLRDNLSISVNNTLVIARYGRIFRGDKVSNAEQFGAKGVLMYTDPRDYAIDGTTSVYPESWWMPPSGVQRGSILVTNGDPLTPGYPSIVLPSSADVKKIAFELDALCSQTVLIDGLPIKFHFPKFWHIRSVMAMHGYYLTAKRNNATRQSYLTACHVAAGGNGPWQKESGIRAAMRNKAACRKRMSGPDAPRSWQGGLNMTYKIGPGFVNTTWRVRMHVTTTNQNVTTYNVFGFIKGEVEPDRYVLLGNHRDAWVFGAVDPTSGTAAMLELSRVLGKLHREGWKPKRTIVFCSWGGEEHGLVGSNEWVEQYVKNLQQRSVAYMNIDSLAGGNFSLSAGSVPMLQDIIYAAAKKIPNPNSQEVSAGRLTVYDTWLAAFPKVDRDGSFLNIPRVNSLGAGSDYAALLQFAGVSALDISYTYPPEWAISSYPLYHSVYETFHLVDNFIDRGFKVHTAVTQMLGEMCRVLSDSLILPLNVSAYASALQEYADDLNIGYGDLMNRNNITLDFLFGAVNQLTRSTKYFQERLKNVNTKNPLEVRQVNDQMMLLERAFTDPQGIPNRPLLKHLISAPSDHNAYAGASFPGLVDLMFEIEKDTNQRGRWEEVRKHLSVLTFVIQSAASTLAPVTQFMDEFSK